MAMVHKFEKVLAKHNFLLINQFEKVDFGHKKTVYEYKNENYEGKVVVWVWEKGEQVWFHYFKQSNGIVAPSSHTTAPSLDRNLIAHYIDKKYD